MTSNFPLLAVVLLSSASIALSNDAIHIDTESDLERQPNFSVDCYQGYKDHPSDFFCKVGDEIDVPSEDLNGGQVGFWTQCMDFFSNCLITYHVQPNDTSFAARFYLRDWRALIWINGRRQGVNGNGWVDIHRTLEPNDTTIRVEMEHLDTYIYAILDRIAVNADLPPLEPPTNSTNKFL